MLGAVLEGIGLGGLMAGWWPRRDPGAFRHGCSLALAAGCISVLVYSGFGIAIAPFATQYVRDPRDVLWLASALTFPSSFLSGMLFTLIGGAWVVTLLRIRRVDPLDLLVLLLATALPICCRRSWRKRTSAGVRWSAGC